MYYPERPQNRKTVGSTAHSCRQTKH